MGRYLGRRLLQSLIIMAGVSVIVFTLVNLIPGNPYLSMLPLDTPPEQVEIMLRRVGYYDPLPVKYFKWLGRVVRGDFGNSLFYREKVMTVIASRLWNTVLLSVSAITISTMAGIGLGFFSARRQKGFSDNTILVFSFIILSIPQFFFAMLLILLFGAQLRLLPISGMVDVIANNQGFAKALDIGRHMIMPTIILGLGNTVMMLRYARSSVIDVLRADYIRVARAHGLSEKVIMMKHTLKNVMIPIVTVLSLQIPGLLSGALLTETVFVWPGIGRLSFEAVSHRDYPLIMGILLIMALITLASNFLADVAYAAIDPRLSLDDSGKSGPEPGLL
ncbi:peptide ABC transporter permease [Spirochaetia bacterium]|nr:peptide ABC transporter permease [Spirochaetia bacterium]